MYRNTNTVIPINANQNGATTAYLLSIPPPPPGTTSPVSLQDIFAMPFYSWMIPPSVPRFCGPLFFIISPCTAVQQDIILYYPLYGTLDVLQISVTFVSVDGPLLHNIIPSHCSAGGWVGRQCVLLFYLWKPSSMFAMIFALAGLNY